MATVEHSTTETRIEYPHRSLWRNFNDAEVFSLSGRASTLKPVPDELYMSLSYMYCGGVRRKVSSPSRMTAYTFVCQRRSPSGLFVSGNQFVLGIFDKGS
ncbi:hypothetical protein NL108_003341 [Boleophthalmus pectinirostris]|nr:hypothetical protein NL108_003341 [Boleophthalmus pectinirostris]